MIRRRLWWAWFLGITLSACSNQPKPQPPAPPIPTPTPPQPPAPTPDPVDPAGAVSRATFDAVQVGQTEAAVRVALGAPYRVSKVDGQKVLVYRVAGGLFGEVFLDAAGKVTKRGVV